MTPVARTKPRAAAEPRRIHSTASGASAIRIGALAPLTSPGWVEAGRHLLAGIETAARDVNFAGGIAGRLLELVVRDTAGDPARAAAAIDEFDDVGVVAVTGEYHSVVARAAAARADELRVPYLCSSAVLDALIDHETNWIARLAPAQSRGWRIYADFLLDAGHRRVVAACQPSVYWSTGVHLLRERFGSRGGTVVELDLHSMPSPAVCDAVVSERASALLLLAGHPEPAVSIVRTVRHDRRVADVVIGAPAGQPEFGQWMVALGDVGAGIPFLRYRSTELSPFGTSVEVALRMRLGERPSFVALEGYDSVIVLAEALRVHGVGREEVAACWAHVAVDATRGRIRFARAPGLGAWQWTWAPIQVVDRDPEEPDRCRILRAG